VSSAVLFGLILIGANIAAPSDDLCERLEQFERRVMEHKDQPQWIEVYWDIDPDAIFSMACKHRNTFATKDICSWLPGHMSMEFAGRLPARISACYGLKGDRFAANRFPNKTVKYRSKLRNNLMLQSGKTKDGTRWMRLAVFPAGAKPQKLPKPTRYEK
jgi:hypothetical protein